MWLGCSDFLADILGKINELNLSLQGKQTTVFNTSNKITVFKKIRFLDCVGKGELERFLTLNVFIGETAELPNEIFEELVQCLHDMHAFFEMYFPEEQNTKLKMNS